MNTEDAKGDMLLAMSIFCIVAATLLGVLPMVVSYQAGLQDCQSTKEIVVYEIHDSRHEFAANFNAYIVTEDGDVFDIGELNKAKLRVGKTYKICYSRYLMQPTSEERTGLITGVI